MGMRQRIEGWWRGKKVGGVLKLADALCGEDRREGEAAVEEGAGGLFRRESLCGAYRRREVSVTLWQCVRQAGRREVGM